MSLPEAIETVLEYVEEWQGDFACPSCGALSQGGVSGTGAKLVTCQDILAAPSGEHFQTCELRGAMDLLEEVGPSLTQDVLDLVEAFEAVPADEVSGLADHLEEITSPGCWSPEQEKAMGSILAVLRRRAM